MRSSPHGIPRSRFRRLWLAMGALSAIAAPLFAGCLAGFDPPSKVTGLRVFAVVADKPYANPGETITFTMTHNGPPGAQIVWLGGCFNPAGDQYFACYESLAEVFGGLDLNDLQEGELPPFIGIGPAFQLTLPGDIVSSRPPPITGPHYGLSYVFFAICAGEIRPVLDEGGRAGAFPIGCFDSDGRRLGADGFVPGYTQIYAFADGRQNLNPEVQGISLADEPISDDFAQIPSVAPCALTEDERRVGGCGNEDPLSACTTYDIEVLIDPSAAELDPESTGKEGQQLTEAVWVDYYADQGDFASGIKLVNDAVKGFNDKREVKWIPPSEPTVVTVWAVVHDARGGAAVTQRFIRVE